MRFLIVGVALILVSVVAGLSAGAGVSVRSADAQAVWEGECTFTETVTYDVDAAGNIVKLVWGATKSQTGDCEAELDEGKGWFRFRRSTDGAEQRVTLADIEAADAAGGGVTPIVGGGLPAGVAVAATPTDFIGISVEIPAGSPGGAHFTSIDLFFSIQTTCKCEGQKNEKEIVVRFIFDPTAPAAERIKHNGAARVAAGRSVTYRWEEKLTCDKTEFKRLTYAELTRWEELDEKLTAGSLTQDEQDELDKREDEFEEAIKDLEKGRILPYKITDSIFGTQNIKFTWTKDDEDFLPAWGFRYKCQGDADFTTVFVGAGMEFDWNSLRADLKGKSCTFEFFAPSQATDWRQEIKGPNGTSVVHSGNIKKDSPWAFEELGLLPDVAVRIPDLAPIAPGNPDLTIYTAVNLGLYMTENSLGFLNGNWSVGQTLSDLGVEIVDGEVAGLQGIYWATTDFEFDPNPAGRGFTPVGGDANLLNSATFGLEIEILQQHSDVGPSIGGTTELRVDDSAVPAESRGSSDATTLPLAAAVGGALVALAIAGLYVRRRLVR